jgi:hypothetical protein
MDIIIEEFEKQLLKAINSGRDTDYVWNGEDEVAVEIFNEEDAKFSIMNLLREHKLIV